MFQGLTIKLTDLERKELLKLRRGSRSLSGERAAYVLWLSEKKSVLDISKQFRRHPHTIRT